MIPEAGLELNGRYRLTERIALGGMGEVWRAHDLHSGASVAAKVLRPELHGDEIFLSRLRAEAANSRGLRHPNLAAVLDSGEAEGSGWIIMELVEGRALSDVLTERGTLPPKEILPIMAQVARALQVVHDAGVVHRDVKPSNILLTTDGVSKLTDFGISTGAHQRPLTATGMVMGTAQYLSPEQAMGNMATPAGDLYALGVIGYEALVGSRPFTGATQVDIAFAHVNDPVPELPDEVPPEVRRVVTDLLAKKPVDRPASAREVARRIDRILVHLERDSWDPRGPRSWSATGRPRPEPGSAAPSPTAPADGSGSAGRPTTRRTVHRPARQGRAARPVGRPAASPAPGAVGARRAPTATSQDQRRTATPTTPAVPARGSRSGSGGRPGRTASPSAPGYSQGGGASRAPGAPATTAPSRVLAPDGASAARRRRLLIIVVALVLLLALVGVVGTLASAHPADSGGAAAPSVTRSEEAL